MVSVLALWFGLFAAQATPPQTAEPPQATQPIGTPAASCSPDSTGKYEVGGSVVPPKLIYHTDPTFSKEARKKKFSGISVISLTVDSEGNPEDVQIVKSAAENTDKKHRAGALSLDDNALAAVRQYRFQPATCQGTPVSVAIHVEVNFNIF